MELYSADIEILMSGWNTLQLAAGRKKVFPTYETIESATTSKTGGLYRLCHSGFATRFLIDIGEK
jgi:hypothetical protein